MNDSTYRSVRDALARQLGTDATQLHMHQQLERDLGINALDRDMIALWLEDVEDVELTSEQVQSAQTVGQLVRLLRTAKSSSEADDRAERRSRLSRFVGTLAPRMRQLRAHT